MHGEVREVILDDFIQEDEVFKHQRDIPKIVKVKEVVIYLTPEWIFKARSYSWILHSNFPHLSCS